MSATRILVSLKRGFDVDMAAPSLIATGMTISRRLHRLGIVTGEAPLGVLGALRALPAVEHVEIDRPVSAA